MTTELDDLLARLCEMQEAVVPNSTAVPVDFYTQESGPYWKNRIDGFTAELESEEMEVVTFNITMTLVLASLTEGWKQQAEQKIHAQLPIILKYFGQRRQLKRTNADAALPFLDPRGAHITGGRADYNMEQSGIGVKMFGIEFSIEVPTTLDTDQVIF